VVHGQWKSGLQDHQFSEPPGESAVAFPERVDQQEFGVDFGGVLKNAVDGTRTAGSLPCKEAVFKSGHVAFNQVGGRPGETGFGEFDGAVDAGPRIEVTKPVAVHLANQGGGEARMVLDVVEAFLLDVDQRLVLGAIHVALARDALEIAQNASGGARFKGAFHAGGREVALAAWV
jgi:hypothetical protein